MSVCDGFDFPEVPATNAVGIDPDSDWSQEAYRAAYPHGGTPAQLKRTEIVYHEPSNTWRLR